MPRIPITLIDAAADTRSVSPGHLVRTGAKLRASVVKERPVVVVRAGDRYTLVGGRTRFMLAKSEGALDILVIVRRPRAS